MKEGKVYWLIISFIILLFDISLIFILNLYSVNNIGILYIVSKSIAVLSFIGIVMLGFFKRDLSCYLLQYIIAIIFQFIPLIIRYLSIGENGFVFSIIILFVSVIVYLCLEFGLLILSKKSLKAIEKLKGTEINTKVEHINEQDI